jgi:hypothetical protein
MGQGVGVMDIEKMIARRVRGGHNEEQSRQLLAELLEAHSGANLDYALAYNGFTR